MAFKPFVRHTKGGVAKIQRDSYGKDWYAQVDAINKRDKCCQHPGCTATTTLHVHHIIALSRGGTTSKGNMLLLCEKHHQMRHPGHSVHKPKTPRKKF